MNFLLIIALLTQQLVLNHSIHLKTLQKRIATSIVAASLWQQFVCISIANDETYGEMIRKQVLEAQEYDKYLRDQGESATVPSRRVKISETELNVDSKDLSDESFDSILKLIPSYKYFKVISKEYSSRSSNYIEGKENLLAPFQ